MSEPAPERVPAAPRAGGGGGNVFTNKIGPLPMWAWIAIAAGILVVWRYESSKSSAASSAASTSPASTAADQVPQFVNQTYTTVTAPSVPAASTSSATAGGGTAATGGTGTGSAGVPGQPGWNLWNPAANPMPPTPTMPQQLAKVASTLASVTGLRSTGAGATNVQLAWNPVSGAQQYQVRVTYQNKVVKTAMTSGTSYNVTGLSPNRTYGLHVVAINGNDWAPEASISQKTS